MTYNTPLLESLIEHLEKDNRRLASDVAALLHFAKKIKQSDVSPHNFTGQEWSLFQDAIASASHRVRRPSEPGAGLR